MKKKTKVAILFGGKSAEHEVSLQSAKNVYEAIDKEKYNVTKFFLPKNGQIGNDFFETIQSCDVLFPVLHGPFGEDGTIQGLLKLNPRIHKNKYVSKIMGGKWNIICATY